MGKEVGEVEGKGSRRNRRERKWERHKGREVGEAEGKGSMKVRN